VPKPSSGIDLDMKTVREELTRKLKLAAKVRVVRTATRSKVNAPSAAVSGATEFAGMTPSAGQNGSKIPMVAIAASTGGPAAVSKVVAGLPKGLPAAVFLVLHMPATFTRQFVMQLSEVSTLPVKEAENNETPQMGTIYLCPGSHHLKLSFGGKISLDGGDRIEGYRPSADLAFDTIAAYSRAMMIGVVLTGMGNDAAKGVRMVRAAGGYVLAQDEATSMIFGMPAEAIQTGAVDEVLPLDGISAAIEKRVAKLCKLVPVATR
jgi:two-component system chemotaxis response regulator CheB